jgi:hypothetical protein
VDPVARIIFALVTIALIVASFGAGFVDGH